MCSAAAAARAAWLSALGRGTTARVEGSPQWVVPARVAAGEDDPLPRDRALRFALQCAGAGNVYWLPLQDALVCALAADAVLMAAVVGTKPDDFEENDVSSRKEEADPTKILDVRVEPRYYEAGSAPAPPPVKNGPRVRGARDEWRVGARESRGARTQVIWYHWDLLWADVSSGWVIQAWYRRRLCVRRAACGGLRAHARGEGR